LLLLGLDVIGHVIAFDEYPCHLAVRSRDRLRDEIDIMFLDLAIRCVLQQNTRLAANVHFTRLKNILKNAGILLAFGLRQSLA